ncbi:MAG: hypothetical protein F6K37_01355 [Moorea sp. SIO4E2]|uniref:hypothetical protein n=1 Tax=Moorena sp. SIO4E2 TaxID=2607826 RepID=UPI0013B80BDE|nr:hypothetical protein [Moorena sp. SIO4E2]NEQ04685.1 hypothetical protein [Moorena sp. SIO4E2]
MNLLSSKHSAISLCATRTLREQLSANALRARCANSYQLMGYAHATGTAFE